MPKYDKFGGSNFVFVLSLTQIYFGNVTKIFIDPCLYFSEELHLTNIKVYCNGLKVFAVSEVKICYVNHLHCFTEISINHKTI